MRKASLRVEAAAIRRRVWSASRNCASLALAERGRALIDALGQPAALGGYYPVRDELDPLRLLEQFYEEGSRVALPATGEGRTLIFREWTPGSALIAGRFGIREPYETQPELPPNPILVPLLAFDRAGNRLGYGAGYYDATLRNLRAASGVIAIGVAFDEQEFPEIPKEPQDETLNMILTPTRIIECEC